MKRWEADGRKETGGAVVRRLEEARDDDDEDVAAE